MTPTELGAKVNPHTMLNQINPAAKAKYNAKSIHKDVSVEINLTAPNYDQNGNLDPQVHFFQCHFKSNFKSFSIILVDFITT